MPVPFHGGLEFRVIGDVIGHSKFCRIDVIGHIPFHLFGYYWRDVHS